MFINNFELVLSVSQLGYNIEWNKCYLLLLAINVYSRTCGIVTNISN